MASSVTLANSSATFYYGADDATASLNTQVASYVSKGVVGGIEISPGAGLTVDVPAFTVVGGDGMVVVSGSSQNLDVSANETNWVCMYSKHRTNDDPILQLVVYNNATYTSHPEPTYVTVLGVVTLGAAATSVNANDISYDSANHIDKLGRATWRDSVDLVSSLPASGNMVGDVRFVRNTSSLYEWTSSGWVLVGTASSSSSAVGGLWEANFRNAAFGHGVLAGRTGQTEAAYSEGVALTDGAAANQIDYDEFSILVFGHYVRIPAGTITMGTAAPGSGTRDDMVALEVWRELVSGDLSSETLATNSGTALSLTAAEAAIFTVAPGSGTDANFEVPEMRTKIDGTTGYRVRYQWITASGLSNGVADAYNQATNFTNRNTVAFASDTTVPGIWSAVDSSADNVDGLSFALPFFYVQRTSTESPGLKEYDGGSRYIFDVYPRTGLKPALAPLAYNQGPSAWRVTDFASMASGGSGQLQLWTDTQTLRVFGYDLEFSAQSIAINSAPSAGAQLELVVMEVQKCLFPNLNGSRARTGERYQFFPQTSHDVWVHGEPTVVTVPSSTATAANLTDAMTAAGWSREASDAGLWSRASTTTDYAVPIDTKVYAIPLAILSRRNTTAWSVLNRNGSTTTRPDGASDATELISSEILDLRHRLVSRAELEAERHRGLRDVERGALRTQMRRSEQTTEVFGTEILTGLEIAAGAASAGYSTLADPDGRRAVWSDAEEVVTVNTSFDSTAAFANDIATWTPGAPGTLTITAPTGSVIEWDGVKPLFSTGHSAGAGLAEPTLADSLSATTYALATQSGSWSVTASDSEGDPTTMQCDFTAGTGDTMIVSFYAKYKRRPADVAYSSNGGPTANGTGTVVCDVTVGGASAWGAPQQVTVKKSGVTGTSFTISTTEVTAQITSNTGLTPTGVTIVGVPEWSASDVSGAYYLRVSGSARNAVSVTGVALDPAFNLVTITVGTSLSAADVYVDIAWASTSHLEWVQMSRPRKLEATFAWEERVWGSDGSNDYYQFAADSYVWREMPGSGDPSQHIMNLWSRTGAGNWNLLLNGGVDADYTHEGGQSGWAHVNFTSGAPTTGDEIRALFLRHRPVLAASDDVLIEYQATPYQGLMVDSSLRSLSLGTVEGVGTAHTTTMGDGVVRLLSPNSDGTPVPNDYYVESALPYKAAATTYRNLELTPNYPSLWLPVPAEDSLGATGTTGRLGGNIWEVKGEELEVGVVRIDQDLRVSPFPCPGHDVYGILPARGDVVAYPSDWGATIEAQHEAQIVYSQGITLPNGDTDPQTNIYPIGSATPFWSATDLDLGVSTAAPVAHGTVSVNWSGEGAYYNFFDYLVSPDTGVLLLAVSSWVDLGATPTGFGGVHDVFWLPGRPLIE